MIRNQTFRSAIRKSGLHTGATIYEFRNKLHRHSPNLNLDQSTRGCEKGDMTERSEKISQARFATIEKSRKRIEFLRGKALNAKKAAAQQLEAVA